MTIEVVDSHTEGEPTRCVIAGWPALEGETMAERRVDQSLRFDQLRKALVCEPRGSSATVGAILTPPINEGSSAGVIFCNNVGYLGMCGHGTIGVVRTLEHLGRIEPGDIAFDTPVGTIKAMLHENGSVSIVNVASRATQLGVTLHVDGIGTVVGDVAYGGNWFFLTELPQLTLRIENVSELTRVAMAIRDALTAADIRGDGGEEIDHVELFGPPTVADAHSKNFVLCPGGEYDRSPCGTGTSAKMATLVCRGELAPGDRWIQESIVGSTFCGFIEAQSDKLIPHITGTAFVTATSTLVLDELDPFRFGF